MPKTIETKTQQSGLTAATLQVAKAEDHAKQIAKTASPASGDVKASSKGTEATPAKGAQGANGQAGSSFKQTLTVFDMVVYGLIFMVPIAPFAIYGSVFQDSGGMPALAYLIACGAMIFTVFSFGMMIRVFPSSGSIYTYTTKSMNKSFGFIAGWLMLLQYIITPDIMFIMAGSALQEYIPGVPVWGWCLIFLVFCTAVATRGIQTTIIIDRIALVAELVVLGIFLVCGVMYVLGHPGQVHFSLDGLVNPAKFDLNQMMGAVSLAVLSFVGFGSVATLTQEAKDEKFGPSRAMLIVVLILGVLFVSMCFVATCISPDGEAFKGDVTNGFYRVAALAGGPWLGILCAVANALALGVFTGLAGVTSTSRILYIMGKSGALPKFLGKMQVKTNTPLNATLFVGGINVVLLLVLVPLGINTCGKISNFGALSTYLLLNLCVIVWFWFRQRDHSNPVRALIFPAIGALVIIWILASIGTIALVTGVVWIVIGVIYYFIATTIFHRKIDIE